MEKEKISPAKVKIRSKRFRSLKDMNNILIMSDSMRSKEDERIRKSIERLQRKEKRLWENAPRTDDFLRALGKQMMEYMGGKSFDVSGPFGLGNEYSISISSSEEDNDKNTMGFITFVSYGDGIGIRNYKKVDRTYPEHSIGSMNGFQYETIEPTSKMNIAWLCEQAKAGYSKKRKKK